MKKAFPLLALALVCALAALALACGSGPMSVGEYDAVMREWTDDLFAVPFPEAYADETGILHWDESETRARIDAFADLLAELDLISPPAEVEAGHRQMAQATRALAAAEKEYFAAAAALDTAALRLETDQLEQQKAKLNDAFNQLQLTIRDAR